MKISFNLNSLIRKIRYYLKNRKKYSKFCQIKDILFLSIIGNISCFFFTTFHKFTIALNYVSKRANQFFASNFIFEIEQTIFFIDGVNISFPSVFLWFNCQSGQKESTLLWRWHALSASKNRTWGKIFGRVARLLSRESSIVYSLPL